MTCIGFIANKKEVINAVFSSINFETNMDDSMIVSNPIKTIIIFMSKIELLKRIIPPIK